MRTAGAIVVMVLAGAASTAPAQPVVVDGGEFKLPVLFGERTHTTVAPFRLDRTQVTNAEFARFVVDDPDWRRDRAPRLFRDDGYLSHWEGADTPGDAVAALPVTHVSWFAANAYCEARGGRLPTLDEWEYAADANRTMDPDAYAAGIFAWYASPAPDGLRAVGIGEPGPLGVHDLHGLVLEWVEDFQLITLADAGSGISGGGCGDTARFLAQNDAAHYATFLRYQSRSSYTARTTTSTLGFRCAFELADSP